MKISQEFLRPVMQVTSEID